MKFFNNRYEKTMSPPFQVAALGTSPSYPNSIAWSEDNLIAVATGHLVTILNPEKPHSPRGVITLTPKDPFPVGTVDRQDLLSACLLPTCLARDRRLCVRSISWSPPGFSSNYGCLLGVCTTEGSVKIYSHPYSEFRAEWLEVMDVSDMLYGYFAKTNYGEPTFPLLSDGSGLVHDLSIQVFNGNSSANKSYATTKMSKKRKYNKRDSLANAISSPEDAIVVHPKSLVSLTNEAVDCEVSILQRCSAEVHDTTSNKEGEDNLLQIVPVASVKKNSRDVQGDRAFQHLTADKYTSRCALVSSLVVVWSPVVSMSAVAPDHSSITYCMLAIGAKSGHISLWRIHTPDAYTVEHNRAPKMMLAGLQQVHNAWVTALAWELFVPDASNPRLLLASGSSDGSVKIWSGDGEDMLRSSEANPASFSLLTEFKMDDSAPISVLSLTLSAESRDRIILAIGKGSGFVEVRTFDIDKQELKTAGCFPMHGHIVTGLAWAFGCCLYSCSQDNSMRGWMFDKDSLTEVPLPPNNLSIKSSAHLPCVYDSCFGVAVSPGNLAVSVVRSFDADLLNPMYQARTQRAAIEFFWIGGQQRSMPSEFHLELGSKTHPALSEKELVSWGSNILWSLKRHEKHNNHLVVWDIMTALSAFKERAPAFLEELLLRWLVFLDGHSDLVTRKIPSSACQSLPKVTSRKLHLLNIFCRQVMLPGLSADKLNTGQPCSIESCGSEEQHWVKLLRHSEGELRERLVGFTLSYSICMMSHVQAQKDGGCWKPSGLSQMSRWIHLNTDCVRHQLKHLASKVKKLTTRLQDAGLYKAEELCTYCSAPVDFESAESTTCRGLMSDKGFPQRHRLIRCAVSMQVCPPTPLWFCVCCERRSFTLMSPQLHALPCYPLNKGYEELLLKGTSGAYSVPFCPFCGILLQRLQPDFLLSLSPV